jgi:hypothetical protein
LLPFAAPLIASPTAAASPSLSGRQLLPPGMIIRPSLLAGPFWRSAPERVRDWRGRPRDRSRGLTAGQGADHSGWAAATALHFAWRSRVRVCCSWWCRSW